MATYDLHIDAQRLIDTGRISLQNGVLLHKVPTEKQVKFLDAAQIYDPREFKLMVEAPESMSGTDFVRLMHDMGFTIGDIAKRMMRTGDWVMRELQKTKKKDPKETGALAMLASLECAIQLAHGSCFTAQRIKTMTVEEMLLHLGCNGIRFVYERPSCDD